MKIRSYTGLIAEIDIGLLLAGQRLDLRKFAIQPLLNNFRILLVGAMQRLLRGQSQFFEQAGYGNQIQFDIKLIHDQIAHHIACPQGKYKLELQGILHRHDVVDLFNLPPIELFRSAHKWLGLKCAGATFAIFSKPLVNAGTVKAQGLDNLFRTVTLFN